VRVRRTSLLVLLLVIATTATGFGLARSARDDNEKRLLDLQADEMTSLFQSLSGQYQTAVSTSAIVAEQSAGDPARFAAYVNTLKESEGGKWFLLKRSADGAFVATATAGTSDPTTLLASNRSPAVDALMNRAFHGEFVVIGIFGQGPGRALALAGGAPGGRGDEAVYLEYPLLAAAASSAPASSDNASFGLNVLDLAIYIGPPTPENLLLTTNASMKNSVERDISLGSSQISLVVATKKPLSGSITSELPWILLVVGAVCGGVVFVTTELTLRRRDRAVAVAGELVEKNEALDRALVERNAADTARAALEDELRQAQRLEAVGQLAGGIAHDFNNLLAAILSFADLAAEDLEGHPAQADVSEIRSAARRGAALTRQLLLFSRHERGAPELVDVSAVVQDLERLLARTLGEDVRLLTGLQPSLPSVMVETGEVEQLVMNLVVNARDAGGSMITIETAAVDLDESATASIPNLSPGLHVQLTVSDTGTGIPAEVLPRIFEPFFTTKERGRGTGLGLATVYGIVQRAGGHVRVRSTSSHGTVFEVLLPTVVSLAQGQGHDAGPESIDGHGQTILYVEDQEQVRAAVSRILERHGYTVLSAHDGPSAYASYGAAPIDLLLTDLVLPGGMTGKDVADRFHERRPELPVVYVSGYNDDVTSSRREGREERVTVVRKPYTEEELLRAVAAALQLSTVPS